MADQEKLQAAYDALCEGFLLPILQGGTVSLARPIGPQAFSYFSLAKASDRDVHHGIFESLHHHAASLVPRPTIHHPDAGTMALVVAAHNLLVLTDPKLDRVFARKARRVILEWHGAWLDHAGPPVRAGAALMRHALVSRLVETERRDTVVKNWAYTYRFFGRPVPRNVVALPKLRFVRETHRNRSVKELWDQIDEEDALGTGLALRQLVARSPLTELLSMPRDFSFGGANLVVLSDRTLRGAAARAIVQRGVSSVAEQLGEAFYALRNAAGGLRYMAAAWMIEILVSDTLDRRFELTSDPMRQPGSRGAARFAALLPAVVGSPGALAPLIELQPDDAARVRARAAALDESLPKTVISEMVEVLGGTFHPPIAMEA